MYSLIQKHKALATFIVLIASGALILWLFFTEGFRDLTSVGKKCVAEVNGSCITLRDYRRELLRFSQVQNESLKDLIKRQVLENLIVQELLYQKARSLGFFVSDEEVINTIKSDTTFYEGGAFSPTKYKEVLTRVGLEPREYEEYVRKLLTIQKLLTFIANGVYISDKEKEINLYVQSLLLSGRLYLIRPSDVLSSYSPTEEELRSYYEKNKASFKKPQVRIIRIWEEKDKDKVQAIYSSLREGKVPEGYKEYKLPQEEEKLPKVLLSEVSKLSDKDRVLITKEGETYKLLYLYKVEGEGIKSFEEAKEEIKSKLLEEKEKALLEEKAKEVYDALRSGKEVSVRYLVFADTPSSQLLGIVKAKEDELIKLLLSKESVFGPYELVEGYGVFVITERKKREIKEEEQEKLIRDINSLKENATVNYLIEKLRKNARIKVNEELLKEL